MKKKALIGLAIVVLGLLVKLIFFPKEPVIQILEYVFVGRFISILMTLVILIIAGFIILAVHQFRVKKETEGVDSLPETEEVDDFEVDGDESKLTRRRKKVAKRIIFWFSFCTFGSGYILYICLRLLLSEMAEQDILVTFRTEGEIKAVMRGQTCLYYIMQVENNRIDPEEFDLFKGSFESYAKFLAKAAGKKRLEDSGFVETKLETDENGNPVVDRNGHYQLSQRLKDAIERANSPSLFEEIFGVPWVGIQPFHVFNYLFRWIKYGQQKAKEDGTPSGEVGLFPREERVNSLFYRYPQYGLEVKDVETGAGSLAVRTDKGKAITKVQVGATFVFETITTNPQKTLFRTAALSSAGDWQQALSREIYDHVRMWLGSTDWDTLVQNKRSVEKALRKIKDDINGVDEDDLPLKDVQISAVRDYGQKIVKITMPSINLKDTQLQTAYEAVFKAEKKRDADIAEAAGLRAKAAAPVLGKADGLEKIGNIPGGKEMYMAEQLGKINVYAPGRDGMFLNVAAGVTGDQKSQKKPKDSPQNSGEESL